jgi:fatty acid desaturase
MPRATVRRLVIEYTLCLALWAAVLATAISFGVTTELVVCYLVPAMLAGNLQSLRKFTEHVGLLGDDVPSTTRTIIDSSLLGRVLSASMLHIDLHGPHHLHAKIPHFRLPEATPIAYEQELCDPSSANVFPSYLSAIRAMVRTLPDPRVGAQWRENGKIAVSSANAHTNASQTSLAANQALLSAEKNSRQRMPRRNSSRNLVRNSEPAINKP